VRDLREVRTASSGDGERAGDAVLEGDGTDIHERMMLNGGRSGTDRPYDCAGVSGQEFIRTASSIITTSPPFIAAARSGPTVEGIRAPTCALIPVIERASANSNASSLMSNMEAPVCSVMAPS
jgi:hypothetical protein